MRVPRDSPEGLISEAVRREILELCELALECQRHFSNGPVTLLGDDQFGDAGVFGLGVVVAVEEHHDVGVLFDGAGLAQVR